MNDDSAATSAPAVIQRVIFPEHGDPQSLPLYLDPEDWTFERSGDDAALQLARARGFSPDDQARYALRLTNNNGLSWLTGRRSLRLPPAATVSLASYFNAFPASYWAAWTSLESVRLRVRTAGAGHIIVFRSNARGVVQRVDGIEVSGDETSEFELPLESYLDGGWLWFDLIAGDESFELVQADWVAPDGASPRSTGTATVSITTLNRGDYCTKLLREIGDDAETSAVLDRVLVVDQGSQPTSRCGCPWRWSR